MKAGRELWQYYHAQPEADPNAAFHDIRLHFQGRNEKGKMNSGSSMSIIPGLSPLCGKTSSSSPKK